MKRVIAVHGWSGRAGDGWFSWLKTELENRGFEVVMPQMPDADEPRIATWVPAIAEAVGTPDEDTYFIGHSMGCGAIIRYIESLPEGQNVGGAVFIAGFFLPLTGLETDAERENDREWYETPIDTEKVRSRMKNSFALFSDNDPWVPVENADEFKKRLGSDVLVQHNQSHFNEGAGFKELPIALEKLLEISGAT